MKLELIQLQVKAARQELPVTVPYLSMSTTGSLKERCPQRGKEGEVLKLTKSPYKQLNTRPRY